MRLLPFLIFLSLWAGICSCDASIVLENDGEAQDSTDASMDAGLDAGDVQTGDPGSDADMDQPADYGDTASDMETDAGTDAGSDAGADADADVEMAWTCTKLGTSYTDGFFSLEAFAGKLYAGLFGYGHEAQSMLYSYPPFQLTAPGLLGIGESVCAMKEFNGYLYANTENSGDIFRTTDGSNWERVYDGTAGSIGCGLEIFQDNLYAINFYYPNSNHGKILRQDGSSWTTVYDSGSSPSYIREIVAYNGTLYAFSVENQQGQMLSSTDGSNWTKQPVANRYFRGHVYDGFLWLGSTDSHANGEVGVWRFDGVNFTKVYSGTRRYVTDIEDLDGYLFAGTSNGWKEDTGPSYLLLSEDQGTSFHPVCTFSETAIWSMAVFEGDLYLGTWDYNHAGNLYKVSLEPVEQDRCSRISAANPAWEVCETGENYCAGVFTDGAGCDAYCAAAGLVCTAKREASPGCRIDPGTLVCGQDSGHQSDWCECRPGGNPGNCDPHQGSLSVGQTYTLTVDAHTGDEATTQPKTDANDGLNGDNPRYRRNNVARAHGDYWYTSSFQEAGEPDPNSPQWVDYVPDFNSLGVGCYNIMAQFRATENRANYAVAYRIINTSVGDVLIERVQYSGNGEYVDEDLGNHFMCPDSYVRIQDPGAKSITFNKMRFTYLGDTCP